MADIKAKSSYCDTHITQSEVRKFIEQVGRILSSANAELCGESASPQK